MSIFLLLPLPAIVVALLSKSIGLRGLFATWLVTSLALVILIPIGSRDFTTYLRDYDDIGSQPWAGVLVQDPLYATTVWICGHLGLPAPLFYFCLATAALGIKLLALHRLCEGHTLPIALYMCSFFFLHEFTQMRAGLAIGIWMLGLAYLRHGGHRYLWLTLLASLVHVQAALGLLLIPLAWILSTRARLIWATALTFASIGVSLAGLTDQIVARIMRLIPDPRVEIYLALASALDGHLNPFNIMSLIAMTTVMLALWRRQPVAEPFARYAKYQRTSTFVFVGLLLGSFSLAAFTTIPIAAQRISEHFFALIPVGIWYAASLFGMSHRQRQMIWAVGMLFIYIFLFHSPYLLHPVTGEPLHED